MVDIYSFSLDNDEFEKVVNGKKTVQLVINEPKRKVYAVGNEISFKRNLEGLSEETLKNIEEGKEKKEVEATIENLLYFADVKEAVETLGKETCGFKPSATFEKATDQFMSGASFENIDKNGIVAIVFKTIE